MKKFLFLIALVVIVTSCDSYERKPFGDMNLTWVKNLSNGLQGLEFGDLEILPVEYDSVSLAWFIHKQSVILAEREGKQILYNFTTFDMKNPRRLDEVVVADKISIHELSGSYKRLLCVVETPQGKMVYMPMMPRGGNEASTGWVKFGPFDEVYCDSREAITKKDGLYGLIVVFSDELPPQFDEIYIEHGWMGICCIAKRPNENRYAVGYVSKPFRRDDLPEFSRLGYLSASAVEELKAHAETSLDGHVWNMKNVPKPVYNKHKKAFGINF